jgi:ectoine hydroxylase-related dioxygenase (phytanoyl-CoA dioxygenase family)
MSRHDPVPRYGVLTQSISTDDLSQAVENLRLLGFAIIDAGYTTAQIADLQSRFEDVRTKAFVEYGAEVLRAIDEHNTIRCPLATDSAFLRLATNERVLGLCERLIGRVFILNQQNGIVNPCDAKMYNQAFYHRDLPYQHFVSSRPLAINALYCLDEFTAENGSTLLIPGTHKEEAFPSDDFIRANERIVTAPAGSFLVLDCMVYHRGGSNRSGKDRRAVNHMYTIGLMRQQLDLPAMLGETFTADPRLRRLLGFDYAAPRSAAEYYEGRRRKQ